MIKNKLFLYIFLILFSLNSLSKHAISYDFGSARFGDKILEYTEAHYLSHCTSLPFLTHPFNYSQYLNLEYESLPYDQHHAKYTRKFYINSASTLAEFFSIIRNPDSQPTLFFVNYTPTDISEWTRDKNRSHLFNIPWEDPQYMNILRKSLNPKISIPDFTKPDILNVAIHVRTLSGDDTHQTSTAGFPLKHPSLDYYERQVHRIYELNMQKQMFVFIFSDTDKPLQLIEHFRQCFRNKNIIFDIQILQRPDLNNVIQDFFAMQKFNVLIATQSNFSMMASRIGKFDIKIFPIHVQGEYPNYRIDRIQMITKASTWFPYNINITLKD